MIRIRQLALLVALGLAGCRTSKAPGLGLPELISRNAAARGGRAAIEAIGSLDAKLRIVEPTYAAEGVWRVDRRGGCGSTCPSVGNGSSPRPSTE